MANGMKRQLKKEIGKLYDEFSDAAATYAPRSSTVEEMTDEFDTLVASGMTELEAYRALLQDVERMRVILEKLPLTGKEKEEEAERKERHTFWKKLEKLRGRINAVQWLLTILLYFFISFTFGNWHVTWLMFIGGSMGSTLLDMLVKYNKGIPLRRQKGNWSSLLWLMTITLYFLISFTFGNWHVTWLMFIGATILQIFLGSDAP